MKHAARLWAACCVVLFGCTHTRQAQPTRELSLPELAEVIEGRKVKLQLSKEKTRTVFIRALRPDSLVYTVLAGRGPVRTAPTDAILFVEPKRLPTRTAAGLGAGALTSAGIYKAVEGSRSLCATDVCVVESLIFAVLLPLPALGGLAAERVLDRRKTRSRYVFEHGVGERRTIVEYVLR